MAGRQGIYVSVNLAEATACNDLPTTKFCLSDRRNQFLIDVLDGGHFTVDLTGQPGADG
jgi:hypothetical protein